MPGADEKQEVSGVKLWQRWGGQQSRSRAGHTEDAQEDLWDKWNEIHSPELEHHYSQ